MKMPLYKYLHPDRIDILQRKRIRFTQPDTLNDPFELKPVFERFVDHRYAHAAIAGKPLDIADVLEDVYGQLTADQRSQLPFTEFKALIKQHLQQPEVQREFANLFNACLNALDEWLPDFEQRVHSELGRKIGILSLSEVPDSELMWAHYGAEHRGFLLEFDGSHSFLNRRRSKEDECYHVRQVVYRDLSPIPDLRSVTSERLLLTKGRAWEYEQEWRVLAPVEDAVETLGTGQSAVHLFPVEPGAVRGVVLGARITAETERCLRTVLKGPLWDHVRIGRARFGRGSWLKLKWEEG